MRARRGLDHDRVPLSDEDIEGRRRLVPLAVMARRTGAAVGTVRRWEAHRLLPPRTAHEVYARVVAQYAAAGAPSAAALASRLMRRAWR